MHRRLIAVVVVVVVFAAVALSGCFTLRTLDWTKFKIAPGESTVALVGVASIANREDIPFFLVGTPSDVIVPNAGNTWDARDKFNGPKKLIRDSDLSDFVLADDTCDATLGTSLEMEGTEWIAVRTRNPVDSTGGRAKNAVSRVRLKALPDATGDDQRLIVFVSGAWDDDDDRVPEDGDDLIACTGVMSSTILVRG